MTDDRRQHEIDDELLSAYLDGELSAAERAAVERRLAADPAARQLLEELRGASRALQSLPREVVGRDLSEAIVERVVGGRVSVFDGKAHSPPETDGGVLPKLTIGRSRRGWVWASVAVAAALLIMFLQSGNRQEEPGNLSAVAQRERTPAELRAAKGATPSEEALAEVRALERGDATTAPRDEVQPPASALAAGPAPAARSAEGRGAELGQPLALGAAATNEPTGADEPLLVVRLVARREAIEQKKFERLLAENGITIEPDSSGDRPETDRRLRRKEALETFTHRRLAETTTEHQAEESVDDHLVLVEAPATSIASLLSALHDDTANYLGVAVETEPAAEASSTGTWATPKAAAEFAQFSRGIVPPRDKQVLADTPYNFEQAHPGRRALFGPRGGSANAISGSGLAEVPSASAKRDDSNIGRAPREAEPVAEASAATSRTARGQDASATVQGKHAEEQAVGVSGKVKKPSVLESEKLKVLFVLSLSDEPVASPASENRTQ